MTNYAKRPQHGALNLVYQISWERQYQKLLMEFLKTHYEFDGSELCSWMRQQGLHDPDHHNHWGTQVKYYSDNKLFYKVGKAVPTGRHGHLNIVALWRSNSFKGPKPKSKTFSL
jgi:glucose/arabinose dehydrogenase